MVTPVSPISRSIVGPNGSSLNLPGGARIRRRSQLGQRHAPLLPALAVAYVDGAVLEGLLADGHAQRDSDQVGVGELLPGAGVAVVEQDLGTRRSRAPEPPAPPAPRHPAERPRAHRTVQSDLGHEIPFSSWCCSTAAATMRPGPIP
jgi:hypothetical protein